MSDQRTLLRTLEMMVMLSQPGGHTISGLAEYFDVHERTIRRTLDTISQAGYFLHEYRGRYYMDKEANAQRVKFDVSELLSFTREEIWRLKAMFEKNVPSNHSYDYLLSKIFGAIGLNNSAAKVIENHAFRLVETIRQGIALQRQLKVATFSWGSANRCLNDVVLEPIAFALDHTRVWCYLPYLKSNVLVRLSDLDQITLTEADMAHKKEHRTGFIDVFGASGFETYPVTIHVNLRARAYLMDEYAISQRQFKSLSPRARGAVGPRSIQHEFSTEVCGFFHIARFCMGLPADVLVVSPDLKTYIEEVQSGARAAAYEPSTAYLRL